jgi:ATP-dependent protease ClpP protease subunit
MTMEDETVQEKNKDSRADSKENRRNRSIRQDSSRQENEKLRDDQISQYGKTLLNRNAGQYQIYLLSIIGEIEGHEINTGGSKTTRYDHVLPLLAQIEDDRQVEGLLILLNTSGGDVDAGLAIAEMIASLSIPTVSLVLGGSHSIGGPLAVSADYSFIVPSGSMIVHPVRMGGTILGAPQTYDYFKRTQDRITGFMAAHSHVDQKRLEEMMINTQELTKDLGTVLIGKDAVEEGLMDEVGGIQEALQHLYGMIEKRRQDASCCKEA